MYGSKPSTDTGATKLLSGGKISFKSESIPKSYEYGDTIIPAVNAECTTYRLTPVTGSTATPGNIIRFEIPSNGVADFRKSSLFFTASATQTGGVFVCFSNFIGTIFKKIRITAGTLEIIDTNDYNLIASFLIWTYNSTENFANAGPFSGIDSLANRKTAAAGKQYQVYLNLEALTSKPWPVEIMDDILKIEITLDQPNNCLEADGTGTNPTFSITNMEWWYDIINLPRGYINMLKSTPFGFVFRNTTLVKNNFSSAQGDIIISEKTACMTDVITIMRNQPDVSSITVADKFITWNYNAATSFQLRHNGHYHPPQVVPCNAGGAYVWWYYLRWLGEWSFNDGPSINNGFSQITSTNFVTNKFMMPVCLQTFQDSALLNGSDVVSTTDNILFSIVLNAAPGVTQEVDSIVFSEYLVTFCNGKTYITK